MVEVTEVIEEVDMICDDSAISKSIRKTLSEVKLVLNENNGKSVDLKIDSAIQLIEDISLDPNISPFARTQIWNLSAMLEEAR